MNGNEWEPQPRSGVCIHSSYTLNIMLEYSFNNFHYIKLLDCHQMTILQLLPFYLLFIYGLRGK